MPFTKSYVSRWCLRAHKHDNFRFMVFIRQVIIAWMVVYHPVNANIIRGSIQKATFTIFGVFEQYFPIFPNPVNNSVEGESFYMLGKIIGWTGKKKKRGSSIWTVFFKLGRVMLNVMWLYLLNMGRWFCGIIVIEYWAEVLSFRHCLTSFFQQFFVCPKAIEFIQTATFANTGPGSTAGLGTKANF